MTTTSRGFFACMNCLIALEFYEHCLILECYAFKCGIIINFNNTLYSLNYKAPINQRLQLQNLELFVAIIQLIKPYQNIQCRLKGQCEFKHLY